MCPESIELRPLTLDDLAFYQRIYTDPRMWAELGGVVEQDMTAKLERDVASVEADRHWVLVIVIGDGVAAGTVSLWGHEWQGETIDEIGWMILPQHQGRGLASAGLAEGVGRGGEGGGRRRRGAGGGGGGGGGGGALAPAARVPADPHPPPNRVLPKAGLGAGGAA